MRIAVVYLARGIGAGLSASDDFFKAYDSFPPGCDHDLIILTKGWEDRREEENVIINGRKRDAQILSLPDDGFDLGAYFRAIPHIRNQWVCFLNTFSRPRIAGWLQKMKTVAESPEKPIGAVGATGSWESFLPYPLVPEPGSALSMIAAYPLRLLRNIVIWVRNFSDFPPFPNPHLRSTGFLIQRELFEAFSQAREIPRSKRDAHILESGWKSLSRFLIRRGYSIALVGADGRHFEPKKWVESGTFRIPEQPQLLVTDNQTREYDSANSSLKRSLERISWNKTFTGGH